MKIAIIGEPPSLDPMFSSATITQNMSSQFFEGLFGRSRRYAPKLALAESYDVTPDAKTHTIVLRKGVTFHNGEEMTSADVVASLKRYTEVSFRGRVVGKRLDQLQAKDKYTVVWRFKEPTGLLPVYLAGFDAIIVPEEIATAAGKNQMKEFIGTGPFKFAERLPDRYTRLIRNDNYAARSGESDAFAGRKTAYLDEIRFIPVPEVAVRADGVGTGEYHFGEALDPDSYVYLKGNSNLNTFIVKPYYWTAMHFNKKQGMFTNVTLRKAVQKAVSVEPAARTGFGQPDFFRLQPGIVAPETVWYTDMGKELYNNPNPDEAKSLLKQAGYKGEAIRWLTTKDYAWNYNTALTIKGQLETIGMKVDLQVMDWATLVGTRGKADLWDIFMTGHEGYTHPILQPFLDPNWPGFWASAEKEKTVSALIAETDERKALALIQRLQHLVYEEAAFVRLFDYFVLRAARKELEDYQNAADWFFWDCWLS
ncbi:MAG TPA: ABC transporter substrate-binding protein [Candidatus Acidoferrum sp.]|nr:ABC transporter substrate-binding protein [Candidatus Acidoferrum sp.]